jgi:exopolysaccharide biosynthesis polyprenyl glycosylphosphotransferase
MLRRDRLIRMQIHQVLDIALFAFSFWLAYSLRANKTIIQYFHLDDVTPFDTYKWLYFILIPAVPLVLEAQGFYDRPILCPRSTTVWQLLKGCAAISLGLVLTLFVVRSGIARWVPVWFGCISFATVFIKEELFLLAFKTRLGQAQYRRRFVLIGTGEETARMQTELRTKSRDTIDIVAELDLNEVPVQRLVDVLHEHSVNGVLVSAKRSFFDQVEDAIRACELEGVEVWLVADFFRTQISRTSLDDFYGHPVMVFRTAPGASWENVIKQLIDRVGAVIALIVLSPFLLLFALILKFSSPGPVLFRQQRSGLNGKPFTLYKFRTMVTNAEQMKHELEAMNEMTGPVFKLTNDPRITRFGRFLRKFSIDEWPQFYNVLRGEMSLVGPRPLPVDEVKRFSDLAHRRRLSVKPGLTCLWQISGRNNVNEFKDWVRLDLEYIDNWSLWLDVKILFRTVPVVLVGNGAK